MNKHSHRVRWVAAAALLVLAATAQAQSKGSVTVRLGATMIQPDVKSGDLSAPSFPGTKADIESDTQPTAGITYMLSDNLALDLPRHEMIRDTINHWAHHRGQMTVYLRLLGAKVPAIYGPSADDRSFS